MKPALDTLPMHPMHARSHALYIVQRAGGPVATLTHARKGRRGGGRRLPGATLMAEDLGLGYNALRSIVADHEGVVLPARAGDLPAETYVPLAEATVTHCRLLIAAVQRADTRHKGRRLAEAIGGMHDCEASWWHACLENRHRPRKVLAALELMYA